MEPVKDIMARYSLPQQPELAAVRRYVEEHYHTPIALGISGNAIVVTVPSAALANTLRLQSNQIRKVCNLEKRLVFRIG